MEERCDLKQEGKKRVNILGFYVDKITMNELIQKIDSFVGNPIGRPHTIVLLNPHLLLEARKNKEYEEYIKNSDVVTADGIGIILAAKLRGEKFPERVTGTDLMPELGKLCARKGYALYLLGGEPGVAEKTKEIYEKKYPGIKIVGAHHGYFSLEEEDGIVKDINIKNTQILIVCMGAYRQEMFIKRNLDKLNVALCFGNGAAFDFISGRVKRAPKWMQKAGLEWFWRLIHEPRRLWKRYLIGNTIFIWLVFKELVKKLAKK